MENIILKTKMPYYHLFSGDFNFANWESKYFARLQFRDFDESSFFKVIKFRESSNWCPFENFHFCIIFNHSGKEMQQETDLNVQQCQHSKVKPLLKVGTLI